MIVTLNFIIVIYRRKLSVFSPNKQVTFKYTILIILIT